MKRLFSVPDVSCDHCKRAIEDEISGLAGVGSVHVDVGAKTVVVDGDAPVEALLAAIEEAGYDATETS